jgi:hypothetical protein
MPIVATGAILPFIYVSIVPGPLAQFHGSHKDYRLGHFCWHIKSRHLYPGIFVCQRKTKTLEKGVKSTLKTLEKCAKYFLKTLEKCVKNC